MHVVWPVSTPWLLQVCFSSASHLKNRDVIEGAATEEDRCKP